MIRLTLGTHRQYLWVKPAHIAAIIGYADARSEREGCTVQVGPHQYTVMESADRIVHLMLRWYEVEDGTVVTPDDTDATPSPLPLGPSSTF
jgi:hypothetical protein